MAKQKEMLRQVSRTFALSIEQLPGRLQDAISVAYLLLRVSDILEDHPHMSPERKAHLLRLWAQVLDQQEPVESLTKSVADLDGGDPEVEVAQNADLVLSQLHALPAEAQESIVARVGRTTLGMARWQDHGPFVEDEAALDDYMHEVAGRVGYLVTDLFAWHYPALQEQKAVLMPLSRECGLALQTVNVIRGLRKDYQRGWVFVPQTYYQKVGLDADSMFDPKNLSRSMQVVAMLADKADRHLSHGLTYITAFPSRYLGLRLALMWPFFFAVRTLAISRENTQVLLGEAKIGRGEVKRIVAQTKLFGWSNRWLYRYYRQLMRPDGGQNQSPIQSQRHDASSTKQSVL